MNNQRNHRKSLPSLNSSRSQYDLYGKPKPRRDAIVGVRLLMDVQKRVPTLYSVGYSIKLRMCIMAGIVTLILVLILAIPMTMSHAQNSSPTPTPTSVPPAFLGIRTITSAQGTQVVEVIPGSPADVAGFQVGDLIIGVNDQALSQDYTLDTALNGLKPGDSVKFTVIRNAQPTQLTALMGVRPTVLPTVPVTATPTVIVAATNTGSPAGSTFMGIGLTDDPAGIKVNGILQGGPADAAGIKVGDLVVSINSQTLSTVSQAQAIITSQAPGTSITVHIKRGDQQLDFVVKLITRPDNIVGTPIFVLTPMTSTPAAIPTNTPVVQSDVFDIPSGPRVRLGVTYQVVTPQLVARNNLPVNYGALVIEVVAGSPADTAGIKPGDVITEVEGDKVDAKRTLAIRMIPYIAGDTVNLTVYRNGKKLSVAVTLVNSGSA